MKKQALKNFTMLGLLLVTSALSVHAQSERSKGTKISFSFIVGQKILPPGEYTIEPNRKDSGNIWLVQSSDGHHSALFATMTVRASETQERGKLVFHKYGNQYFLSQIWRSGENGGRELRMSHEERELAKNTFERQTIVLSAGKPDRN
jgi:hypothetical protein